MIPILKTKQFHNCLTYMKIPMPIKMGFILRWTHISKSKSQWLVIQSILSVFCCGLVSVHLTHILQGYFINNHMIDPMPMKQLERIWLIKLHEYTKNCKRNQTLWHRNKCICFMAFVIHSHYPLLINSYRKPVISWLISHFDTLAKIHSQTMSLCQYVFIAEQST